MGDTYYFDLTAHEMEELKQLSDQLFNSDMGSSLQPFALGVMFKVFTEEEKQTAKFKRYDILLKQRLRYLKQIGDEKK